MTDTPANNPTPEIRNWCEAWRTCLQNVLSQVSGQPNAFEIAPQPLPPADSDVWYAVVAGGAVHGEMSLRVPAASGTRLAQKFLGEAPPPADAGAETSGAENISAENKEALEELLRQIAGLAATALASTAGGEVQLSLSASAGAPSWPSDAIICLQTSDQAEPGAAIALEIQISPALAAELQPKPKPAASPQPAAPPPPPPVEPATAASYRRLMDVGLDVKLRFGTRRMLLRDVLALSAGVVVEMENSLNSPVDLLLDDRLIAQGEVVIVDGKYGLRITDVVDTAPAPGSP